MQDDTTNPPLKRCTRCHEWKPATAEFFYRNKATKSGLSFSCKVCGARYRSEHAEEYRIRHRQYCKEHPEVVKGINSRWYAKHREDVRERGIRYRAENAEKVKERKNLYYAKNKDKRRAYNAKYYAQNTERLKAYNSRWSHRNLDKGRSRGHRREARALQLAATFTAEQWRHCLEYWGHRCAVCGRQRGLWHTLAQDHWIPLVSGGAYTADNILPLCHGDGGCNNRKKHSPPHEWLVRTFGKRKAAQIERRIHAYFATVAQDHPNDSAATASSTGICE